MLGSEIDRTENTAIDAQGRAIRLWSGCSTGFGLRASGYGLRAEDRAQAHGQKHGQRDEHEHRCVEYEWDFGQRVDDGVAVWRASWVFQQAEGFAVTDWIQVRTTLPEQDKAREMARWAIESGWAACAQVSGPIESTYRWQGQFESSQEWTLLLKTHRSRWHGLVEAIQAEHPYECPELVAESLAEVSDGYAVWLAEQVPPEMG